jgi:hypothetical protein
VARETVEIAAILVVCANAGAVAAIEDSIDWAGKAILRGIAGEA